MKKILFTFLSLLIVTSIFAQDQVKSDSPYETKFWTDAPIIAGTVGLNVAGVMFIQNKEDLTDYQLSQRDKNDIWGIDRWAAGNYSLEADRVSYIPFYGSFALPIAFLAAGETRSNIGQISVMYVESMATAGAMFTITAGLVDKSRPLVYNPNVSKEERIEAGAQRSFFAGHVAATAAATFFTAKIFNDFYPDSPLKPYVWGAATAISGYVGYLRIEAGKHFLTDSVVGLVVGASAGILIPELHKKENKNLSLYPTYQQDVLGSGYDVQGLGLSYRF